MNQLGWDANVSMPTSEGPGSVFFKKRHVWNNRPTLASSCQYGYRFDDLREDVLNSTAQRAAELCLTLYEKFGRLLPSNPNIYGEIRVDPIANAPQYVNEDYNDFVDRHKDKQFSVRKSRFRETSCVVIEFYRYDVVVMSDEFDIILQQIDIANETLSGNRVQFS